MIARAGLLQVLILALVLLVGAILPASGREAQAARQPHSGVLTVNSGHDSAEGAGSPAQLDEIVYLPFVITSCVADPPGESDNIDDALIVCSGQTVLGQVGDDNWDDVFKIRAVANQQLDISMNGSGDDADLYLYAPDATDINSDDYAASSTNIGNDEFIQLVVPEEGYWYVDVNSFDGTTDYNVAVTLSAP